MLHLPTYGAKIWWENLAPIWRCGGGGGGERRHPWESHTYQDMCATPDEGAMGTWKEDVGVSL